MGSKTVLFADDTNILVTEANMNNLQYKLNNVMNELQTWFACNSLIVNPLTPNDHYSGRTAPLTSKHCILYIYSTNTGTEYFKHGIYSPFLSLQNAVCFIILTYSVPVLFTFYIEDVLKFKKIIPAPKYIYIEYTSIALSVYK